MSRTNEFGISVRGTNREKRVNKGVWADKNIKMDIEWNDD